METPKSKFVIPAKAEIQSLIKSPWIPPDLVRGRLNQSRFDRHKQAEKLSVSPFYLLRTSGGNFEIIGKYRLW